MPAVSGCNHTSPAYVDVAPVHSNCFIGLDGTVKLGDFGLSKDACDPLGLPSHACRTGSGDAASSRTRSKSRGASIDLDNASDSAGVMEVGSVASKRVGGGAGDGSGDWARVPQSPSGSIESVDVADSRYIVRTSSTSHTSAVGTRSYASPEQLSGSEYDEKSDMYR